MIDTAKELVEENYERRKNMTEQERRNEDILLKLLYAPEVHQ